MKKIGRVKYDKLYVQPHPWIEKYAQEEANFIRDSAQHGEHLRREEGRLYEPRLLVELEIYKCLAALLDKPNIEEKNEIYWKKWMKEIKETGTTFYNFYFESFLKTALDHCLYDCKTRLGFNFYYRGIPGILCQNIDVSYSKEFKELTSKIGMYSVDQVRIHPGSKDQMIDLVHPTWHCSKKNGKWTWIASRFENGMFSSYINNLHPEYHSTLYKKMEEIINQFALPMLDFSIRRIHRKKKEKKKALTPTNTNTNQQQENKFIFGQGNGFGSCWLNSDKTCSQLEKLIQTYLKRIKKKNFKEKDYQLIQFAPIWPDTCILFTNFDPPGPQILPMLKKEEEKKNHFFCAVSSPSIHLLPLVSLKCIPLHFYIKIAKILLTPKNPIYTGSSYHVEGIREEHIASSAIYYFDMQNVTDSYLEFRVPVTETSYEQNDDEETNKLFGLSRDSTLLQNYGRIKTRLHDLICFPNTLQHRVTPFELLDKTKNGWRSFLVIWLVYPGKKVKNTDKKHTIKQRNWIHDAIHNSICCLPTSLIHLIVCYLSCWDEEYCQQTASEMNLQRTKFYDKLLKSTMNRVFNLCEH